MCLYYISVSFIIIVLTLVIYIFVLKDDLNDLYKISEADSRLILELEDENEKLKKEIENIKEELKIANAYVDCENKKNLYKDIEVTKCSKVVKKAKHSKYKKKRW